MNRRRMIPLGLSALLILFLAGFAWAARPNQTAIEWQVLSGGGGPSVSGAVALNASLGQTAIGASASAGGIQLGAGYWYGVIAQEAEQRIYLPVILRNV